MTGASVGAVDEKLMSSKSDSELLLATLGGCGAAEADVDGGTATGCGCFCCCEVVVCCCVCIVLRREGPLAGGAINYNWKREQLVNLRKHPLG